LAFPGLGRGGRLLFHVGLFLDLFDVGLVVIGNRILPEPVPVAGHFRPFHGGAAGLLGKGRDEVIRGGLFTCPLGSPSDAVRPAYVVCSEAKQRKIKRAAGSGGGRRRRRPALPAGLRPGGRARQGPKSKEDNLAYVISIRRPTKREDGQFVRSCPRPGWP